MKRRRRSVKRKPLNPGLYTACVTSVRMVRRQGRRYTLLVFEIEDLSPNLRGTSFGTFYPKR